MKEFLKKIDSIRLSRRQVIGLSVAAAGAIGIEADAVASSRVGLPKREITSEKEQELDSTAEKLVAEGKVMTRKFRNISADGNKYEVTLNPVVVAKVALYTTFLYGGDQLVNTAVGLINKHTMEISEQDLGNLVEAEFVPPPTEKDPIKIMIQPQASKDYFQGQQQTDFADTTIQHENYHFAEYASDPEHFSTLFNLWGRGIDIGSAFIVGLYTYFGADRIKKKILASDAVKKSISRRDMVLATVMTAEVAALAGVLGFWGGLEFIEPGFNPYELQAYVQSGGVSVPFTHKVMADDKSFQSTKGKLFSYKQI